MVWGHFLLCRRGCSDPLDIRNADALIGRPDDLPFLFKPGCTVNRDVLAGLQCGDWFQAKASRRLIAQLRVEGAFLRFHGDWLLPA